MNVLQKKCMRDDLGKLFLKFSLIFFRFCLCFKIWNNFRLGILEGSLSRFSRLIVTRILQRATRAEALT